MKHLGPKHYVGHHISLLEESPVRLVGIYKR